MADMSDEEVMAFSVDFTRMCTGQWAANGLPLIILGSAYVTEAARMLLITGTDREAVGEIFEMMARCVRDGVDISTPRTTSH